MAKPADKPENLRYERKFVVSELMPHEIEALVRLHPAMFFEAYPQRFVNNLYLDSHDLKSYFDNVDGLKDRMKVRIRWYGDLFGIIEKPVLELKSKNDLVGEKASFPLVPFAMDERFQLDTIHEVFRNDEIPEIMKMQLLSLEPVLLNRYSRKYFQSVNHDYRITIDSEMEFYAINAQNNTFSQKYIDTVNTVVELKYDCGKNRGAPAITSYFPFRLSKNSKYANGIERLYAW
ncbi:VTC domain-containing protein [candidate division KSB1 bacterium]|nr:VTC domain-containing protein [candidate division KSB1 bacterium]